MKVETEIIILNNSSWASCASVDRICVRLILEKVIFADICINLLLKTLNLLHCGGLKLLNYFQCI